MSRATTLAAQAGIWLLYQLAVVVGWAIDRVLCAFANHTDDQETDQ